MPTELPGLLGDPGQVGVSGATSEMDTAAAQLNEEEHVHSSHEKRLHSEEITGQYLVAIVAEKSAPRNRLSTPMRCRVDAVVLEDVADSGAPYRISQLT